jgi:predicted GNAT family N-acyltransferase
MSSDDVSVEVVDWESGRDELRAIRDRVFIEEQGVPSTIEIDDKDANCTHFLLRRNSVALGCARLQEDGKVTRMAVLPEQRGRGLGAALLTAIIEHAKKSGTRRLFLHAQDQAINFYEGAGFKLDGEGFLEADIPHHAMSLDIDFSGAKQFISGVHYPEPFATLAIELAATANRQLRIYSPKLDHAVFDRQAMADAIAALARNSRYSDVRILVCDSEPMVKQGHRLLNLSRRLPSSVHIQTLSEHPNLPDYSFVIRDTNGTIYKPTDNDREGFYEPDSRASAKRFIEQFDELWSRSKPDPELRILGI